MTQETSHPNSGEGPRKRETLFTKDFVLAIVINTSFALVFYMLVTGMAVYAASEFAAGESAAGFAASSFIVGALVARIFAGKYVNLMGRRRTLVVCLILYIVCSLLYLVVGTLPLLFALRIVHGMAFGFGSTALTTAVFELIPAARRGEGTGYYSMANALPPAIGPAIALQLTAHVGFWAMFAASTITSVIAFSAALFLRLPERRGQGRLRDNLMLRPREVLESKAMRIAFLIFLLGIGFAGVMTFLNGFAHSLNLVDAATLYFLVYSVTLLLSRLFMGKIQDRFGDNAATYPAMLCFILSLALLAWVPSYWTIVLSGLLGGFGFGALFPVMQAITVSAVDPARISIAVSTFFILLDVGFGVAPVLLGLLVEFDGYQFMFGSVTVLAVVTTGLYWLLHGRFNVHQGTPRRGPNAAA